MSVQPHEVVVGRDGWNGGSLGARAPSIFMTDGPCGVVTRHSLRCATTAFPCPLGVAASWDVDLARLVSGAIGREAAMLGFNLVLGPCVNIVRTPLGGRTFECFSEDPVLSSSMSAAYVEGMQGAGVGACVKHFAANNQESFRKCVDAVVGERAMREIYLPSFHSAVRSAGAAAVMTAYNKVNGSWCSENQWLLADVLRREWAFDGLVVSDWSGCHDLPRSLNLGLDLKMPGPPSAEDAASVSEAQEGVAQAVRDSKRRQQEIRRKFHTSASTKQQQRPELTNEELARSKGVALEAARASVVVLKNEHATLPLSEGINRLGVFGLAVLTSGGGGSSWVPLVSPPPSAPDCLRAALPGGTEVVSIEGEFQDLSMAESVASDCDAVVIFAGLPPKSVGENKDQKSLNLPPEQEEFIRVVCQSCHRSVVVLCTGSVISVSSWQDCAQAIVVSWYSGTVGPKAVCDVLCGTSPARGCLPVSWWAQPPPFDVLPFPLTSKPPNHRLEYQEGISVGYRHPSCPSLCSFQFGHGLSYSSCAISDCSITGTPPASDLVISFSLTPTSPLPGVFIIQAFVRPPPGPIPRPSRELKGFACVPLSSASSTSSQIVLKSSSHPFSYFDDQTQHSWSHTSDDHIIELRVMGQPQPGAELTVRLP